MVSSSMVIEMHVLTGDAIHGLWCPHCALPSAATVPIVGVNPETLRLILRTEGTWCLDCGRQLDARPD